MQVCANTLSDRNTVLRRLCVPIARNFRHQRLLVCYRLAHDIAEICVRTDVGLSRQQRDVRVIQHAADIRTHLVVVEHERGIGRRERGVRLRPHEADALGAHAVVAERRKRLFPPAEFKVAATEHAAEPIVVHGMHVPETKQLARVLAVQRRRARMGRAVLPGIVRLDVWHDPAYAANHTLAVGDRDYYGLGLDGVRTKRRVRLPVVQAPRPVVAHTHRGIGRVAQQNGSGRGPRAGCRQSVLGLSRALRKQGAGCARLFGASVVSVSCAGYDFGVAVCRIGAAGFSAAATIASAADNVIDFVDAVVVTVGSDIIAVIVDVIVDVIVGKRRLMHRSPPKNLVHRFFAWKLRVRG